MAVTFSARVTRLAPQAITNWAESINEQGELVITATIAGNDIQQTLAVPSLPVLIFGDPATKNLYAIYDIREVQQGWRFLHIITRIT